MNYEEEKIARLKEAALERVSGGANASRETVRQRRKISGDSFAEARLKGKER